MPNNIFFSVNGDDLARLTSQEAVDTLASLLRSEAWRLQLPATEIDIPRAITVGDGGVDAEVRNVSGSIGIGAIKAGLTRYQVKTGSFSLGDEAELKSIFFKPGARRKAKEGFAGDDLQPRVRTCLDEKGTLVIVLFGFDKPDATDDELVSRLRKLLGEVHPQYVGANIEIWRQNKLITLVEHFPALALNIKRVMRDTAAVPHTAWLQQSDLDGEFVANEETQKLIAAIRAELLEPRARSIHIRLVGEPGIGKTRLIYEATKHEILSPLVVYSEDAESLVESDLFNRLLGDSSRLNLVLVADECRPETRAELRRKFRNASGSVRIVSIFNEVDEGDRDREYRYYEAARLNDEEISAIIQQYGVPKDEADFWSPECEGSPRVANIAGKNLADTGDVLRGDGLVRIWDRYVAGLENPRSDKAKTARFVLQCLALFKKIGIEGPKREIDEVFNAIIVPLDGGLSRREFSGIVDDFRRRKVLQGQHVVYLTPKLLHIRLWREWWETYGTQLDIAKVLSGLSEPLGKWFVDMLVYAKESPASASVAKELLGPSGPLYKNEWLDSRLGGELFFNLAQVEPQAALRCLKETLGSKSPDELRQFRTGRFDVVHALRLLATDDLLFLEAARLLLMLAEAETEAYSNNATGTFTDLFTLGYGRAATTALPPAARLVVLEEALKSSSKARRALAISAFDKALQTRFTQLALDDRHGLRRLPSSRWSPKTYGEVWDEYERYWMFLRRAIPRLEPDEQMEGARVLIHHAREMFFIERMRPIVLQTFRELVGQGLIKSSAVLEVAVEIQHYDGKDYPAATKEALGQFVNEMQGSGYGAMLRRYVGLGLLEDQFDENGNETDDVERVMRKLADDASANPEVLSSELAWLVTHEAKKGYAFGRELGIRDTREVLWPRIRAEWYAQGDKANDFFVGGYLLGVFEVDQRRWESIVKSLAAEEAPLLADVVWRSGMTNVVADVLTQLLTKGVIPPEKLQLFAYGGASRRVPEKTVNEWIQVLIETGTRECAAIAVELFDYRFKVNESDGAQFPVSLAVEVLTQRGLLHPDNGGRRTMLAHHWARIAKRVAMSDSRLAIVVVDWVLENFETPHTLLDDYGSEVWDALTEITKRSPVEVWNSASKFLTLPLNRRAFGILQWLRGGFGRAEDDEGALLHIPRSAIWGWIDEDIETRAWLIAQHCPKQLKRDANGPSFALELLERYGGRDDVRSSYSANYNTEGWSGPITAHYAVKIENLRRLLEAESNDNVRMWLRAEIASLERTLEVERIREEREG